tara:strand:+ start:139 stop:327 length:189 start_codon:yes stop_codon:yes gene_type:complete
MTKNIIIELNDGIIQSVYCPDEEYNVHILDWDSYGQDDCNSQSVVEYFNDVEEEKKNLKDCY